MFSKHRIAFFLLVLLLAPPASAVPSLQGATGADGEASVTLKVPTKVIDGDTRTYCQLQVQVGGEELAFAAGDTLELAVYDDDVFDDDLVWSQTVTVTDDEVSKGEVARSFDCSGPMGLDMSSTAEIFAEAKVVKAACGFWCSYDRPETTNLDVLKVQDDGDEPNDTLGSARSITSPSFVDRAGANEDWYAFSATSPTSVALTVAYRPADGRLDVGIFSAAGTGLVAAQDGDEGASYEGTLGAGDYLLRIRPRVTGDFNFYDVSLIVGGSGGACTTGAHQTIECGQCGQKTRTCDSSAWTSFGACTGEGECTPDSDSEVTCGSCGTRPRTCSNTCSWVYGACADPCADAATPIGHPCDLDAACEAGFTCLTSPARSVYAGGYCGRLGCVGDAECGEHGLCGIAFGEATCLRRCATATDCRQGYLCTPFGADSACIPRCIEEADCRDIDFPYCDVTSGLCSASATPGSGTGWTGQTPTSEAPAAPPGGGCAAGSVNMASVLLGLALLFFRRRA